MTEHLAKLATVVAPYDTIDQVIRLMAKESGRVKYPGIAVVLDGKRVLLGIMTDGDIRRG